MKFVKNIFFFFFIFLVNFINISLEMGIFRYIKKCFNPKSGRDYKGNLMISAPRIKGVSTLRELMAQSERNSASRRSLSSSIPDSNHDLNNIETSSERIDQFPSQYGYSDYESEIFTESGHHTDPQLGHYHNYPDNYSCRLKQSEAILDEVDDRYKSLRVRTKVSDTGNTWSQSRLKGQSDRQRPSTSSGIVSSDVDVLNESRRSHRSEKRDRNKKRLRFQKVTAKSHSDRYFSDNPNLSRPDEVRPRSKRIQFQRREGVPRVSHRIDEFIDPELSSNKKAKQKLQYIQHLIQHHK